MKTRLEIWGIEKIDSEFKNMSLTQVYGDADLFRLISRFFSYAADQYDQYGGDEFDHEHFCDWCNNNGIQWSGGDLTAHYDRTDPIKTTP